MTGARGIGRGKGAPRGAPFPVSADWSPSGWEGGPPFPGDRRYVRAMVGPPFWPILCGRLRAVVDMSIGPSGGELNRSSGPFGPS